MGVTHRQLVLVDHAGAPTGDVGGADVHMTLELLRREAELEHVAGPVDVHSLRQLLGHCEVVDRSQVVDAPDLARESRPVGGLQAEAALGDVTGEDLDPAGVDLGRGGCGGVEHPRLDERDDLGAPVLVEQLADETAADEAGEAGDQGGGHNRES